MKHPLCPVCTHCGLCESGARSIKITGSTEPDAFQPEPPRSGYGLAIDVGTTTVHAVCCDLKNGAVVSQAGVLNEQTRYAADVIARMQYASQPGGAEALQQAVKQSICTAAAACLVPETPEEIVITGNTVMLHLLFGYDTAPLMQAPFCPQTLFGAELPFACTAEQENGAPPAGRAYVPPCVSAFVGADTVCAVLAARQSIPDTDFVLLDIGTNCEIACYDNSAQQLYCTAAAAGPAFEGGGISCGMPALPGAIADVRCADGAITISTIGGENARGICGSGLLSAAAEFLSAGLISPEGTITKRNSAYAAYLRRSSTGELALLLAMNGAQPVLITQSDIRNLQYAAAAVAAGTQTLLCSAHKSDWSGTVAVCGGFGANIQAADAQRVGLIPPHTAHIARSFGNAAARGALLLLLKPSLRQTAAQLAQNACALQLADNAFFQESFIRHMRFPDQ